jgi:hypothetical protein
MAHFEYRDAAFPIRDDIRAAHRAYWRALARPGSWWSGAQRIAIARESRNAIICAFCAKRKQALSPYALEGTHTHANELPIAAVDAVHRIVTDQTRITRRWVEDNVIAGLSREAYVELVGVVVAVFSIDGFSRALGLSVEALPEPEAGEPNGYRPVVLSDDIGFVPTVPADGAVGEEADLWPNGGRAPNVVRALTLVPQAMRDWRSLGAAQYLSFADMANFVGHPERSINRMQMELIAGRVSAINQCFY